MSEKTLSDLPGVNVEIDKSQWVRVHFCYTFMDAETEKRVKTYRSKSVANREITKWLNRADHNFCQAYHYDSEQWYRHETHTVYKAP
ncbi:hypothetical protein [Methylophaga nitratireducenticrescens]|uniref:hypothetical protein n=1 Tax=Methylophaga nitratireducenticrescens TaxID=754476 RepID=UPI000CDBBB9D|nr:hypothetical protein [Methylophaga nitratireducenticrescens]AUZ86173.1 hypothetical protein CDW43_16085 [Methylophaga nitratireducenticrescens]